MSFPLHCKIYTDNCLSPFIIYCIGNYYILYFLCAGLVQLQPIPHSPLHTQCNIP